MRDFPRAPERMFLRGQTICVQGVAKLYRRSPQIEVRLWDPGLRLLTF
jgi:DNA/RNA endonuclease YhcR with UshA esterase domain